MIYLRQKELHGCLLADVRDVCIPEELGQLLQMAQGNACLSLRTWMRKRSGGLGKGFGLGKACR